jgi:hypothetical protein
MDDSPRHKPLFLLTLFLLTLFLLAFILLAFILLAFRCAGAIYGEILTEQS